MATTTTKSVKKNANKDIKYNEEFFGTEMVKTYIIGEGSDDPVIGCLNGHNWAVEVNKEVEIPVSIMDIIKSCRRVIEESKAESKAFETGAGKNLTQEN